MQGWIKLHRKILDNEIWNDVPTFRLFTLLLLNAAHTDGMKVKGVELKKGQYMRSYRRLAEDLAYKDGKGLKKYSLRTIHRCFAKLIQNGMVSVQETEYGTLITVLNYASYQHLEGTESVSANANGNEIETNRKRERNNNKNEKNIKKEREGDGAPVTESKISPDKQARVDAVSTRYITLRNRGTFLSPDDLDAIERTCDLDVDLKTLISWLEEIFRDHNNAKPYDPIRKFRFCETSILNRYRAMKNNVVPFGSNSNSRPKQETLRERWERLKREGKLKNGGN